MDSLGAFNLVGLTLLGIATLIATSLVYGPARRGSTDLLRRILTSAGWFLVVAGLIGGVVGVAHFTSVPLIFISTFVLAMSIRSFRRQEHVLRLWQIAIAADRGISLVETLRAMGREQGHSTAWKPRRQADALAEGRSLAAALDETYDVPARGPALAVGAAADWGNLAPALREALKADEQFTFTVRDELGRFFYIYVVMLQLLFVLVFLVAKILPVMSRMLSEFGMQDYPGAAGLNEMAAWMSDRWWLPLPFIPFALALMILMGLYFLDLWPSRFPGLSWFSGPIDRAWILRGLAWGIQAGRPIPEILASLARHYRVARVRWKLDQARELVAQNVPWINALHRAGLLRASDAAVLRAAERSGNLEWALLEQATGSLSRWGTGMKRGLALLFPIVMCGVGLVCAQIAWYFFSVLAVLIEKLA